MSITLFLPCVTFPEISYLCNMNLKQLTDAFLSPARRKALKRAVELAHKHKAVAVTGAAGSSAAMMLAGLDRPGGAPVTVVGDSRDDAGYLYQDLCALCGDEAVIFFPSGFKRDIKFGQPDAPSQVLRTEALGQWADNASLRFVVTYPEAIAERVAPRKEVSSR